MGGGNFPATDESSDDAGTQREVDDTLGKTRTQKTRNLLDQSLGSEESVVLLLEFCHQLLVLGQPLYNASQ